MIYGCTSNERTEDYTYFFETTKKAIQLHLNRNFAPEILVADGAESIRNGFYNVFSESAKHDIMCFAHVARNIRKRPFASKTNKPLIMDDIRKIQLAPSVAIFELMTRLFLEKWEHLESNFVVYFKKEWLGKFNENQCTECIFSPHIQSENVQHKPYDKNLYFQVHTRIGLRAFLT